MATDRAGAAVELGRSYAVQSPCQFRSEVGVAVLISHAGWVLLKLEAERVWFQGRELAPATAQELATWL